MNDTTTIPYAIEVPVWMEQIVTLPKGMSGAAAGPWWDCHKIAHEAWGDELHGNSGLTAFAYLWRRFGPPWRGTDDHKRLAGTYILGTPLPDVLLWVDPSGSDASYASGYLVTQEREKLIWMPCEEWDDKFEAWWLKTFHPEKSEPFSNEIVDEYWKARYDSTIVAQAKPSIGEFPRCEDDFHARPVITEVADALLVAMKELLRPVYIRDIPINVRGRCDGCEHSAEKSKYAGYGIPKAAMDAQLEPRKAPQ